MTPALYSVAEQPDPGGAGNGEPKVFSWADYRDLIITAHRQLAAPLIWCWDNLNIHLALDMADFAKTTCTTSPPG